MGNKFWKFSQNNSGGYFVYDANCGENIFVEAESEKKAWKRIKNLVFGPTCSCCGDRWSSMAYGDIDWELISKEGEEASQSIYLRRGVDCEEKLKADWIEKFGSLERLTEFEIDNNERYSIIHAKVKYDSFEQYVQINYSDNWGVSTAKENQFQNVIHYLDGRVVGVKSITKTNEL